MRLVPERSVPGVGQVAQSAPASHAKPGPVALAGRNEEDELRNLILTMVDEPLAIVIKLADRLHNMRTVWALKPGKARAVATETLRVWCSLAERLGIFALKARLLLEPSGFSTFEPLQPDDAQCEATLPMLACGCCGPYSVQH